MTLQHVECETQINNTPDAVLAYIADVRNRTFYLPSLKAIGNIQGEPVGPSTTWQWTWSLLGIDFVGHGQSLDYQPGKLYSFKTSGGIDSNWTYRVAPQGSGTHLTVCVDYTAPTSVISLVTGNSQARHQNEVDQIIKNLKTVLDR